MKTIYEYIKPYLTNENSILDVGCIGERNQNGIFTSYCNTLIEFYLVGCFNKIYGIDIEKLDYNTLLINFTKASKDFKKDLTAIGLNSNSQLENTYRLKNIFHFEIVDLEISNISFTENFDVISLSNILHFLSDKRKDDLLNYCIKNLNPDGFIYIEARADSQIPHPIQKDYLLEIFKSFTNLEIEQFENNSNRFRYLFQKQ